MAEGKMTFQQVLQQSKDFQAAADEVAEFHLNNFQTTTPAERDQLDRLEKALRDVARRLLNEATAIIWDDMQDALQDIRNATDKMRAVHSHLNNIQRTIAFATAGLTLAGAILAGNPIAVGKSGLDIIALVDKFRKEDDDAAKDEDDALG